MEGAERPVKADLPGSPDTREPVHTEAPLGSGSSSTRICGMAKWVRKSSQRRR